jgi:hypothetical protein
VAHAKCFQGLRISRLPSSFERVHRLSIIMSEIWPKVLKTLFAAFGLFRLIGRKVLLSNMSNRRRSSNFQGAKQQALGSKGPQVAPAWKVQAIQQGQPGTPPSSEPRAGFKLLAPETGSKILISYLPQDVTERDLWVNWTHSVVVARSCLT